MTTAPTRATRHLAPPGGVVDLPELVEGPA